MSKWPGDHARLTCLWEGLTCNTMRTSQSSSCGSQPFFFLSLQPPQSIDDNQVGFYDLLKIKDKGGLFCLIFAVTGLEICCATLIQFSLISAIFQ